MNYSTKVSDAALYNRQAQRIELQTRKHHAGETAQKVGKPGQHLVCASSMCHHPRTFFRSVRSQPDLTITLQRWVFSPTGGCMTSLKGLAVFASLLLSFCLSSLFARPAAAQTVFYACVNNSTGAVQIVGSITSCTAGTHK